MATAAARRCRWCDGYGYHGRGSGRLCRRCGGAGTEPAAGDAAPLAPVCPDCDGTGTWRVEAGPGCRRCDGDGRFRPAAGPPGPV